MDRRKLLISIAFVLSVILFASLLYYFFFRTLLAPQPTVNGNNTNGTLPRPINGNISTVNNSNTIPVLPGFDSTIDLSAPTDIARGGLTRVIDLSERPVQDFVSGATGAFYYNRDTSQFYRLEGANAVLLSDKKFFNVDKVTWAKDLGKAILEYPDGSNIVYDFNKAKQITLPKELTDFSFDTSGNTIAAKWIGDNKDDNWLMVGDADGSNFRLIEPLSTHATDVQVGYSPNNQVVALYRRVADATSQEVFPLGTLGENFQSFRVDGLKFESKWAPTGDALLYNISTAETRYKPQLWLTTGGAETLGNTQVNLTLNTYASKCTFDATATSIYCAEPGSLPDGAGLYPELAAGIPDAFYRIDLRSGQKIPLALPVGNQVSYSANSVFLSADETLLYFVDGPTGRLHAIRLK